MSALSHVYSDRTSRRSRSRHGRRLFPAYRQTLAALGVSVMAGLAIFATAPGSLTEGALAAPPAAKGPPPGWIDFAFAQVDSARVDAGWAATAIRMEQSRIALPQNAQKPDTRKQDPCADFVYYFLNTNCSVKRVGSVRRDSVVRRAVAARTPLPAPKQVASQRPERITFAATNTIATD